VHNSKSGRIVYLSKAKRQQQVFFLCESEATATSFFSVRKRSDSNNYAKAKLIKEFALKQ